MTSRFHLADGVEILRRTPAVLRALLQDLPDEWGRSRELPESWSAFDIVGHLIHGEETDWLPRARIILEHGEARPFAPYDRFAQTELSRGKSLGTLLDEFEAIRHKNLEALEELNITESNLEQTGSHPVLGTVTLRQLLSTWVVHDLGHLRQVARAMAHRYRNEVGPWNRPGYLNVLQPPSV